MEVGYIFAIGAAMVWGLVYAIDQQILAGMTPVMFLFIGSVVSAVIMLPFVLLGNDSLKSLFVLGRTSLLLILASIVLATLADFFILSGIKHMDASTASIIEIAYPFFVVLFSYFFFKSSPNIYFFIGGLLIFAGSAIIIKFA